MKYLNQRYVSVAPSQLTSSYTPNQIVEGIYNGGEQNYTSNVLTNMQFGPIVSGYINDMSFYYGMAGGMIGYADPGTALPSGAF